MKKLTPLLAFLLLSCASVTNLENQDPVASAYVQQKALVDNSNKTVIGYKAGLTSKAGQAKFGVTEPVAGVLFKEGLSHNRQVYQLADYHNLMLETEIGFILGADIDFHPPTVMTPNFFINIIEEVVPVIELPDLAYPDMSKVTGLTLIKTNVASNQLLIGKGVPIGQVYLNKVTTKLTRNGQIVVNGNATDAMGDQAKAVEWLIWTLYKNGHQLKKGDLLITGALGKMIPAKRGQYDADFGELGKLAFSIR